MRSVPAGITALIGQSVIRVLWLVKWELNTGTRYLSNGPSVSFGGNTYEANRVKSISGLVAQYVDRIRRDFPRLNLTLDNLADNGSASFPYTVLDASEVFEDKKLTVYCFFPGENAGLEVWWGYSGRPKFNPTEKTVEVSGSFIWDSRELVIPTKSLPQAGFATLEGNTNKDPLALEIALPLVYGVSSFKIRPTIYHTEVNGGDFNVNFIVSGTAAGLPFQTNDVTAANCRLFGTAPAVSLEFRPGGVDTVPPNLSRFPDGLAHDNVAYGVAVFAITDQIKDKLDDIEPSDIKLTVANGRPLIDTSLPSENPVLILKDVLRDPLYGLGLANAAFDSTAVSAAAAYAASKWQSRLELHERMSVGDFVQATCADFNGFVTFNNGLIQIGVKTNAETPVAKFVTSDSGHIGLKIHNDDVETWEEDASEVSNQLRAFWRKKNRQKREAIMYDPTAQARAGSNIKKVVEEDFESLTLYQDTQVQIAGACILRQAQNGNLMCRFKSPLVEGLLPAPGDVIEVRSPDIFNNSSNYLFRVIAQPFESGDEPLTGFECEIYKPAINDYTTTGIGVDLLRGGEDTSLQGRPPDVTPTSLSVQDVGAFDVEGKLATIRGTWTYPVVNLAAEQADGIFREYPISAVQLWWHYTDESENEARMGKEAKWPTPQAEFQIDYHKNRSIKVWFVALGANRSRSKLGYIPDPTKVSALTSNHPATSGALSYNVVSSTPFNVNDYIQAEFEINRILSVSPGLLATTIAPGFFRQTYFDSVIAPHVQGTEVAVLKQSYPSLTLPLTAPRFTYKTVTGLLARQKPDGVRAKWNDVDAANREVYYLYWSADADAGTNPAKLGTATPAWYLSNPDSPPTGINLSKNDDLSHLIDQADIGGTGTPVFVRVAARNGKHNWSSQLSTLQTNSAGGSAIPNPTDAPSTPSLGLIISQAPNLATSVADSKDVFRVFASQANNSLTFAQTGTPELILIFRDAGDTKDDPWPYVIDDTSLTFVDIPVIGTLGKSRIWRRTVASNGAGGKTKSPTASVAFFAGGKITSLAGITGLVINSVVPVANTKGRKSDVTFTWTSPNPAPLIAQTQVRQKNSAEVVFSKEAKENFLDEEALQVPGAHPYTIRVGHPKNDAGQYKIRLVSVDGTFIESPIFNSTSQDEDTGFPNNAQPISITRCKLKGGSHLLTDYVVPILQMNTYEKTVLQIHDDIFTGIRRYFNPVTSAWETTDPNILWSANMRVAHAEVFAGGRTRVYVKIGVRNRFNGGSTQYSNDLTSFIDSSFVAGNSSEPDGVLRDTTAPANLNTPILDFSRGLYAKMSMSGVTQVNTLKLVEATISNGVNSLNLNNPSVETIVAGADVFYPLAKQTPKLALPFSKRKLRRLFGQTASIYVKFRLTNDIGPTTSSASSNLALDSLVDVVAPTDDNVLWNGHLLKLESAGVLAVWQAYQPAGSNAFNILDIGTGRLRYQDNEHRAKWQVNPVSDADTNKRWLVQFLGDLLRGSYYSGYFMVLADGNRTIDMDIFIATINGGARQIESLDFNGNKNPINITTSLIANIPKRVEFQFRYATDAVLTLNTYFVIRLNSRVDAGLGDSFVYADEYQMNPGLVVGPYTTRRLKEGNIRPVGPQASAGTTNLLTGEENDTAATSVNLAALVELGEGGVGTGRGAVY